MTPRLAAGDPVRLKSSKIPKANGCRFQLFMFRGNEPAQQKRLLANTAVRVKPSIGEHVPYVECVYGFQARLQAAGVMMQLQYVVEFLINDAIFSL